MRSISKYVDLAEAGSNYPNYKYQLRPKMISSLPLPGDYRESRQYPRRGYLLFQGSDRPTEDGREMNRGETCGGEGKHGYYPILGVRRVMFGSVLKGDKLQVTTGDDRVLRDPSLNKRKGKHRPVQKAANVTWRVELRKREASELGAVRPTPSLIQTMTVPIIYNHPTQNNARGKAISRRQTKERKHEQTK